MSRFAGKKADRPNENNLSPNTKLWIKFMAPVLGTSLVLTVMDSLGFKINNAENWFVVLEGLIIAFGYLLRPKP